MKKGWGNMVLTAKVGVEGLAGKIKQHLLEKRARLEAYLDQFGQSVEGYDSGGDADPIIAQQNAQYSRTKKQLDLVNGALERIERGGYGICEGCHHPISQERLEIMPEAPHCVDCARKQPLERSASTSFGNHGARRRGGRCTPNILLKTSPQR